MTNIGTIEIGYDPPRFWWTKRIVVGSVLLVALIVGLIVGATVVSQRKLDAIIKSCRAAGEPVYVEDFNVFKDIPDEENAATYYYEAEKAYTWPTFSDAEIHISDLRTSAFDRESRRFEREIERLINTNGEAIRLLKQGAQCDEAEWGVTMTQPIINSIFPNFRSSRDAARLLGVATAHAHMLRRDDQAIELMIAQHRLGKHRFAGPLCTINHLVARALIALNCDAVERLAFELRVAPIADSPTVGAAPRHRVRALINDLLDESSQVGSLSIALASERASLINTIDIMCQGQLLLPPIPTSSKPIAWMFRPILKTNGRRGAEYWNRLIFAAEQDTFPQVTENFPDPTALLEGGINRFLPAALLGFSWERVVFHDFRLRANRRMAAIALAIRLFEVDRGHRPDTLDELIPEYLEAIPRDPFAHGDEPIRYLPEAQQPVLYSVGSNGLDDGGKFALKGYGYIEREKFDLVFFLDGDRTRGKP